MPDYQIIPFKITTQRVVIVSVTAGIALLGILARYLRRRRTVRPPRRARKLPGGRRTRNSMRSPNDVISVAGSKASARSVSPGGSMLALSDRLSLASGSLGAGVLGAATPLTSQQLGVLGMEALENVITHWEDALATHCTAAGIIIAGTSEETEFCYEIQNLLDAAYTLQDQSELLFLDQRSVLFREESYIQDASIEDAANERAKRSGSDPNLDSAESFASALDQVADLREFEEFTEVFAANADKYPLYQSALRHMEDTPIPCRTIRTELVNCSNDMEYLGKLHCLRLAFQLLFRDEATNRWVADTGRQILTDLMCLGDKDPKDFLVGYEEMMTFLQDDTNWPAIERELEARNVKAMTFFDVVLDFIILDAFKDLDSPPGSVIAVVQNRFLSNGFKETALTTAVWSVLKAKRRLLKYPNGFMAHFYLISEQISPLMAWGFFGPDDNLREVCQYFREETIGFLKDIFSFQKCRFTTVEELSEDILKHMRQRVENIGVKFSN
ncbi:mitoguardin [Lutzomyia longipalpis]|uniref:Mitoguardin n=1 Tax=Lutzomyia longipalpis TaxID=7200 RepID=A0A1B0CLQ6_LUTLO|nr:mitoguardin [Lutzomyia longipalpis]